MRYFTVRVENTVRQTSREADIPASQLIPLFQDLEAQLKKDGFFSEEQELLKRLVPGLKSETKSVQVQVIEKDMAPLGSLEYDIYTDRPDGQVPDAAIGSLSLWFCVERTGRVCSVTFPISQLFQSAAAHLLEEPVTGRGKQRPGEDGRWGVRVFLKGDGPLYLPRKHRSSTLLIFVSSEPSARDTQTPSQRESSQVEVLVTERKPLFTPEKRSLENYKTEFVGVRQRGDLRVLMSRTSIDDLWEQIRTTMRTDIEKNIYEMGGFLFGNVYEDQDGKPFIDINATVTVDQKNADSFTWLLRSQPELAQVILGKIKDTFPGKKRVGWYHSHLDYVEVISTSKTNPSSRYAVDMSAYDFSSSDRDLHRSLFPESWHVALVVDLKKKKLTFYQLKRGEIEPCQGYYIYAD